MTGAAPEKTFEGEQSFLSLEGEDKGESDPVGDAVRRDRELITKARQLRRSNTPAERKLWSHLANRKTGGAKFRRQHPIGPYIVDFVSLEHRWWLRLMAANTIEQLGR
jgi:hypothetical protein